MKKFKTVILGSLVLGVALILLLAVVMEQPLPTNRRSLKKIMQQYVHGRVVNHTNHPVQVSEYRYIHMLPPGKHSSDIDIYDVDSLVIDRPTEIEGTLYTQGVFRFCDFGYMEVRSLPDRDVVISNRGGLICRLIGDYRHYQSVQDAF